MKFCHCNTLPQTEAFHTCHRDRGRAPPSFRSEHSCTPSSVGGRNEEAPLILCSVTTMGRPKRGEPVCPYLAGTAEWATWWAIVIRHQNQLQPLPPHRLPPTAGLVASGASPN